MKRYTKNVAQWLLLVNLSLSFYMVGEIWLTQVSCYPLWAYVGPAEYHAYHVAWWRSIWGVIFIPGGFVTLCAFAMLRLRPPGVPAGAVWLGIVLQVLIYGLTAAWWGRLMAELESVSGPVYGPMYHQLLLTHWGRVAIVTAYGMLQLWMAVVSLSFQGNNAKSIRGEEFSRQAAQYPAGDHPA
jgi:hypothetical protein